MAHMSKIITRIKVVATSAVTYLTAAAAAIPLVAAAVAEQLPEHSEEVVRYGAAAVGWIAVAILIIRRVFPAPPEARGLELPAPTPTVDRIVADLSADFTAYAAQYGNDDVTTAFLVWRDRRAP